MLLRATAKSYNKVMVEVVSLVRNTSAGRVAHAAREYFTAQRSEIAYWPDNDEVRRELDDLPMYRRLSRARLRMVLESMAAVRPGPAAEARPQAERRRSAPAGR